MGEEAWLSGWGRQWHNGPLSSQLEMVKLPIVSNEECMRWYNNSGSRQFIPSYTFLCAGYEEGEMDACSGDSGGPLTLTRGDQGHSEAERPHGKAGQWSWEQLQFEGEHAERQ